MIPTLKEIQELVLKYEQDKALMIGNRIYKLKQKAQKYKEILSSGFGKDSGFGKIPCGHCVNIVPKNSPLKNKKPIKVIKLCSECKEKLKLLDEVLEK